MKIVSILHLIQLETLRRAAQKSGNYHHIEPAYQDIAELLNAIDITIKPEQSQLTLDLQKQACIEIAAICTLFIMQNSRSES